MGTLVRSAAEILADVNDPHPAPYDDPEWLTPAQAMELLGYSRGQLDITGPPRGERSAGGPPLPPAGRRHPTTQTSGQK